MGPLFKSQGIGGLFFYDEMYGPAEGQAPYLNKNGLSKNGSAGKTCLYKKHGKIYLSPELEGNFYPRKIFLIFLFTL